MKSLPIGIVLFATSAVAQQLVSIPVPQTTQHIEADLYGSGDRTVILAHGGRFNRASWREQAQTLAQKGFAALAISFRGDRPNPNGSPGSFGSDADNAADVLAAVAWLQQRGVKNISAVGGSFGGTAVGNADSMSKPGTFNRIVLFASEGGDNPAQMHGRKLFIVARDDIGPSGPRLKEISSHYEMAPQPKKLVVVEGSAHAQFLFGTKEGGHVLDEIIRFLSAP